MQSLTQPTLLLKPFAESGDKNTIPVTNTDASNPQLADLTNGFPQITSADPDENGLPPERKDFNGLGYLTTTYDYFYQAGGTFTFNPTISSAIGGYPLGARLWYTDNNGSTTVLRSTIANNTNNFNNGNMTGWTPEIPALGWNNTWTGSNTFTSNITVKMNKPKIFCDDDDETWATDPSSDGNAGSFEVRDSNGNWGTLFRAVKYTNGRRAVGIQVKGKDMTTQASFDVFVDGSGGTYASATQGIRRSMIGWGIPNWSSGVEVSESGYTAPTHGVFWIYTTSSRGHFVGTIAGQSLNIGGDFSSYHENSVFIMPVYGGETITWTTKTATIYFFPMRGV